MNTRELVSASLHNYLVANNLSPEPFGVLLEQIARGDDLQDRDNLTGHVTSSFMLLDPSRTRVLLVYHRILDRWTFPGGHYEGNVCPRTSALRRLEEETGFPAELVDYWGPEGYLALDVASLSFAHGSQLTLHHDFLYLGVALADHELRSADQEVEDVRWFTLEEALAVDDSRVRAAVQRVAQLNG